MRSACTLAPHTRRSPRSRFSRSTSPSAGGGWRGTAMARRMGVAEHYVRSMATLQIEAGHYCKCRITIIALDERAMDCSLRSLLFDSLASGLGRYTPTDITTYLNKSHCVANDSVVFF